MASKSIYLSKKLLDHELRAVTFTPPATVYLALFTTTPGAGGVGGVEVSAGNYARQVVTFGAATGTTVGDAKNSADVVFPTATVDYGTVTGWALFDALTNGNMLHYGAFTTPKSIVIGLNVRVKTADLDINES